MKESSIEIQDNKIVFGHLRNSETGKLVKFDIRNEDIAQVQKVAERARHSAIRFKETHS